MRGATSVANQLIHGDVEGQVTIRNCVLMNGSHFGIQMGNIGGHFDVYNNLFISNRMAACEVRSMNQRGTMSNFVTMYGNAYPFEKVTLLFGAIPGIGAQEIKE